MRIYTTHLSKAGDINKLATVAAAQHESAVAADPNCLPQIGITTGASSGIGAATAVHFAKLGYHLSLCGRNKQGLSEIKISASKPMGSLLKMM